ncbi:PAS domain S-box protein [Candidatus Pyrohabitans sp.]
MGSRGIEKIGAIIDALVDAIVITDINGKIVLINKKSEEIFGYREGELEGRNITVLIPPKFVVIHAQAFKKFLETGDSMRKKGTSEVYARRKDGSEFPVEMSFSKLEVNGNTYVAAIIRDISERKQIEEALRDNEAMFRTLAEYSLVGVYLIQDGVFKYVNPRLAEIFGYRVEELVNKKGPKDMVYPEDWPVVEENIKKRIRGEITAICYEFRGIKKNGEVFYVEVYGARVMYRGKPAVIGTLLDITDRKLAEEKINHLNSVISAIRGINQLIVRERDKKRLLMKVCELMQNVRRYSAVKVWLIDERGELKPVSHLGEDDVRDRGLAERAIATCEPVVVKNHGALAALPIIHENNIYGVLCLHSAVMDVFNKEELELLAEVAEDIAYALKAIEGEEMRKRAEDELQQQKAFYETLIHSATDLILVINPEGRFVYANRTARETLGEDVLGKHISNVVAPEYLELTLENFRRRLRGEEVKPYIIQAIDKNGVRRWAEINGNIIKMNDRVIGTCAIARDVTERLRLEEEAAKTREFLHSILESSADAIIATDVKGRITYFSRGAEEMLGYKPEQAIGRFIFELYPPAIRKDMQKLYSTLFEKEVLRNIKTKLHCIEGRVVDVNLSLALLRDQEGKPVGSVGVAKDITREVLAEEALKRAYEELRRLDQLKSDIIANVSHEIRTPITIAKGYIELAKQETDENERISELRAAIKALMRLNDTVDDLIAIADIERGDFSLNLRKAKIDTIISRAIETKEEFARSRKVDIKVEINYSGELRVDPLKLQRAMMNLIDNAIKFNRKAGKVRVSVDRKEEELLISVSDTGIGIPQDKLEDIFKPLTQLDPSPTRYYGGTGTGLAVAKKIIEAHGGKIWAESSPGEGSTFYFTIPLEPK